MRNTTTDLLGNKCNRAFKDSGLNIPTFINWVVRKGGAFDVTVDSFCCVRDGRIVTFYFAENNWYAKY